VLGVFFIGMAVLQAWPGRGFWQGTTHGGTLTGMLRSMAATPQPSLFAGWVRAFASFTAAHGFAVNLFAVIALAAIGASLIGGVWGHRGLGSPQEAQCPPGSAPVAAGAGQTRLLRLTVIVTVLLCLADWVLIEDFGFFGGLGTDPNSMIPMILVVIAGYLALTRVPAPAAEPVEVPDGAGDGSRLSLEQLRPARLARAFGAASTRAVVAGWAVAIIVLGAAPMALAQANPNADPIIAQAIDGNSAPLNFAAPAFTLTDQDGRQVSLASLRGKVVLLTFLDPVCTSDCPLIAQEFRQADQVLGARSRGVELVAIVANPLYRSIAYTRAFDNQENMTGLPNWLFLTGSLAQLQQAWKNYYVSAEILPPGGMIGHSDLAYVIDASGHTRTELDFDPGPGTTSSRSSFAVELSDAADQVMRSS
jgi:cytochrome oxidase Cu insertion factor (SCO1/SenC/PrrC family)